MNLKYFFSILIFTGLCSCVGKPIDENISKYYRKSWGSVYFTDKPAKTMVIHGNKIKGANAKTFIPLSEVVAKDKNRIYYRNFPQPQVDKESFLIKEDGTMKDKNHIYFPSLKNRNEFVLKILYNVDLETYGSYTGHPGWAYDKDHVYQGYSKPVEADPSSFAFLSENFMKDKDFLYSLFLDELKKLKIETDSLIVLNETYVRDNHQVYFFDAENTNDFGLIPFHSTGSITILPEPFIIIENKIYSNGQLLNNGNINIPTFKVLDEGYCRDTSHIFYSGQIVPTIDAHSFELLTEGFAKDKQSIYFMGHILKNVDSKSFKIINSLYFIDKNHVYYIYSSPGTGKEFFLIVDKANPKTFYHNPRKSELYGADDKNEFYDGGMIIKNY